MSDMLNRIKRRSQRPSVERDTSLIQTQEITQPVAEPPISEAPKAAPAQTAAAAAAAVEEQLAELPQISQRRNIRLEIQLEERLLNFCQRNEITIETFLESCFVEAEQDSRLQSEMVTEAQRRLKLRKQAGQLRRVMTQLKNRNI